MNKINNKINTGKTKKNRGQVKESALSPQKKGREKEERVCRYLIERGWRIISRNQQILGVEIDILARKNRDQAVIEVKSISNPGQIEKILKSEQKKRLQQAAESLCEQSEISIGLFLAVVDPKNQIEFFEIS